MRKSNAGGLLPSDSFPPNAAGQGTLTSPMGRMLERRVAALRAGQGGGADAAVPAARAPRQPADPPPAHRPRKRPRAPEPGAAEGGPPLTPPEHARRRNDPAPAAARRRSLQCLKTQKRDAADRRGQAFQARTTRVVAPTVDGELLCPQCEARASELGAHSAAAFADHVFDCRMRNGADPLLPVMALLRQPPTPTPPEGPCLPAIPAARRHASTLPPALPRTAASDAGGLKAGAATMPPPSGSADEPEPQQAAGSPGAGPFSPAGTMGPFNLTGGTLAGTLNLAGGTLGGTTASSAPTLASLRPLPTLPPAAAAVSASLGGPSLAATQAAESARSRATRANSAALRVLAAYSQGDRRELLRYCSRLAGDPAARSLELFGYEPVTSETLPIIGQILQDHPGLARAELAVAEHADGDGGSGLAQRVCETLLRAARHNPGLEELVCDGPPMPPKVQQRLEQRLEEVRQEKQARECEQRLAERQIMWTRWTRNRDGDRAEVEAEEKVGRREVGALAALARREALQARAAEHAAIERRERRAAERARREAGRQRLAGVEAAARCRVRAREVGDALWMVTQQEGVWQLIIREEQMEVRVALKLDEEADRRLAKRAELARLDCERVARADLEAEELEVRATLEEERERDLGGIQQLWDSEIKLVHWLDKQREERADVEALERDVRGAIYRDEHDSRLRIKEFIAATLARQAEEDAIARQAIITAEASVREETAIELLAYFADFHEEVAATMGYLEQKHDLERMESHRQELLCMMPNVELYDGLAVTDKPFLYFVHPVESYLEPPVRVNCTATVSWAILDDWDNRYDGLLARMRTQAKAAADARSKALRASAKCRKTSQAIDALDVLDRLQRRQSQAEAAAAAAAAADGQPPPRRAPGKRGSATAGRRQSAAGHRTSGPQQQPPEGVHRISLSECSSEDSMGAALGVPPRSQVSPSKDMFKQGVGKTIAVGRMRRDSAPGSAKKDSAGAMSAVAPGLAEKDTGAELRAEKVKVLGGHIEFRCVEREDGTAHLAAHDLLSCLAEWDTEVDGVRHPGSSESAVTAALAATRSGLFELPDHPDTVEAARQDSPDGSSPTPRAAPPAAAAAAGGTPKEAADTSPAPTPEAEVVPTSEGADRPGTAERPTTAEQGSAQTLDTPCPATGPPGGKVIRVLLPADDPARITPELISRVVHSCHYQSTVSDLQVPTAVTVRVELSLIFACGSTQNPGVPTGVAKSVLDLVVVLAVPLVTLQPGAPGQVEYIEGMAHDELQVIPDSFQLSDPPAITRAHGRVDVMPGGEHRGLSISNLHDSYVVLEILTGYTTDDYFAFKATSRTWLDKGRIFHKDKDGLAVQLGRVVRGALCSCTELSSPLGPPEPSSWVALHMFYEEQPGLLSATTVRAVLKQLRFANISQAPMEGPREARLRVADRSRHCATIDFTISVIGKEDPTEVRIPALRFPVRTSNVSAQYRQHLMPNILPLFTGTTVHDVDTDRFAGGFIKVTITGVGKSGEGLALCVARPLLAGLVDQAIARLRLTRAQEDLRQEVDELEALVSPGRILREAQQDGELQDALGSSEASASEPGAPTSPDAAASQMPRKVSMHRRKTLQKKMYYDRAVEDTMAMDDAVKDYLVGQSLADAQRDNSFYASEEDVDCVDDKIVFQGRTVGALTKGGLLRDPATDNFDGQTELIIQFSEDGMASIEAIQAILRHLVLGVYTNKLSPGLRSVDVELRVGPTVVGHPEHLGGTAEIPEIPDEVELVPIPTLQLRAAPALLTVPEKYVSVDYREGCGAQRLAPFEMVAEKAGFIEQFNQGFIIIETVSGGEEEDRIGLRDDDMITVRQQQKKMQKLAGAALKRLHGDGSSPAVQPGKDPAAPLTVEVPGAPKPASDADPGRQPSLSGAAGDGKQAAAAAARLFGALGRKGSQGGLGRRQSTKRSSLSPGTEADSKKRLSLGRLFDTTRKEISQAAKGRIGPQGHMDWTQVSDVFFGERQIGTMHESGRGLLLVQFRGDAKTPVMRKHVLAVLKNLSYSNFSSDPQVLEKMVRITISDQPPAFSQCIVKIHIHPVDDVTEILAESLRLRYTPVPPALERPFCLCPYGKAKLYDPDTDFFDGGYIAVQELSRPIKGDRLGFLSKLEQELVLESIPEEMQTTEGPFCAGEVYSIRVAEDGKRVFRVRDSGKKLGIGSPRGVDEVHVANLEFDKERRNLKIEFMKPSDKRVVPLTLASYILNCISFSHDSQDLKPKPQARTYAIKVCDGDNPQEGKIKLTVDTYPPPCIFTPWSWTAEAGPPEGQELEEGLSLFDGKTKLSVQIPDSDTAKGVLALGHCLISVENGHHLDSITIRADLLAKEGLALKNQGGQNCIFQGAAALCKVTEPPPGSIRLDFGGPKHQMQAKHLQAVLRAVCFRRKPGEVDDPQPPRARAALQFVSAERPADVCVCTVEVRCIQTDSIAA